MRSIPPRRTGKERKEAPNTRLLRKPRRPGSLQPTGQQPGCFRPPSGEDDSAAEALPEPPPPLLPPSPPPPSQAHEAAMRLPRLRSHPAASRQGLVGFRERGIAKAAPPRTKLEKLNHNKSPGREQSFAAPTQFSAEATCTATARRRSRPLHTSPSWRGSVPLTLVGGRQEGGGSLGKAFGERRARFQLPPLKSLLRGTTLPREEEEEEAAQPALSLPAAPPFPEAAPLFFSHPFEPDGRDAPFSLKRKQGRKMLKPNFRSVRSPFHYSFPARGNRTPLIKEQQTTRRTPPPFGCRAPQVAGGRGGEAGEQPVWLPARLPPYPRLVFPASAPAVPSPSPAALRASSGYQTAHSRERPSCYPPPPHPPAATSSLFRREGPRRPGRTAAFIYRGQ